jgi:broad specificity phosphatase PhoE
VRRLLLVRHAPTAATHRAAFPADESLDEDATVRASSLVGALPPGHEAICSPALRARQTAAAAALQPQTESRLAECDFGAWAGHSLAEIHATDPAAAECWMTDPDARPHGGETLTELSNRVAALLEDAAGSEDGCLVAITHGGVVKAAVAHVLGAPLIACWRIDIEPLTITELRAHDRQWTVKRVNCPVEAKR